MEFGEDTGSEDTSNTGEDGEDDLEDPTRQPGEVWDAEEDEEEDEDEEDLVEHDEEEDDEDDEEDVNEQIDGVGGDEGDEEMMWQVRISHLLIYVAHSLQSRTSMPSRRQDDPRMRWTTKKIPEVSFLSTKVEFRWLKST